KVGWLPPVLILGSLLGLAYLTVEKSTESTESSLPNGAEKKITQIDSVQLTDSTKVDTIIKFTGDVPAPKKVSATPECVSANGRPLFNENLQVQNGRLQNVFVWISEGLEGKTFPIPSNEVEMDQKNCAYQPHVVGVQAGQTITFLNSDAFLHNVHSMAKENDRFNVTLTNQGQRVKRKLMKPEIMLRSKCDIHPWMTGYVGVVSHPFFGVSDTQGKVTLTNIPPGTYTLSAWHETLGIKTQKIDLSSKKQNQSLEFSFP
ncbi:MAG: plastocyanin/azurin family copper-binding protein, partial [Deltaproteobacteria bacterium]